MQSDNDPVVALTDPNRTPRPNARRMLLRGSFAVPTVLTLSSGSALANTSSLRCFNSMPTGIDAPPHNYFRVKRYKHDVAGVVHPLVNAEEIILEARAKGFDARDFTYGKGMWINARDGLKFTTSVKPTENANNPWVALRFESHEANGSLTLRVTGLSRSAQNVTGTGRVLTSSCWSSFQ
jgi:hypothetical protein